MKLAMVGVGKLGVAILEGILNKGILERSEIGILEHDGMRAKMLAEKHGVRQLETAQVGEYERALIAVKPSQFAAIAEQISHPHMGYLSTMAGISTQTLSNKLHTERVVRTMPNLGATVGKSATAITALQAALEGGDYAFGQALFAGVGDVYELPENLFNAFTGLSGSGPAYAAVFAEALADGGVRAGIPRALALELAAKTLISTGELLLSRPNPATLKDEVSSPGGTTIAGLAEMERYTFRIALIEAVAAATRRGEELGRESEG